jgi:hypothetical protein
MGQAGQALHNAVVAAPLGPSSLTGDAALRLVAGFGLYVALIWLHPIIIGVSPLP